MLALPPALGLLNARDQVGADIDPLLRMLGVPNFSPIQDSRFYFNYHHSSADTLDKIDPHQLAENAAINAVLAYALANLSNRFRARTLRDFALLSR